LTKLLADENVPLKAVEILREKGVDVASVTELSPGLKDREVLDLARREGRIIVTFDKDFGELVVRERAKAKGLILLRFVPRSPQQVAEKNLASAGVGNPAGKQPDRRERAHRPNRQNKALSPPPRKEPARWKLKSGPRSNQGETARLHATVYP